MIARFLARTGPPGDREKVYPGQKEGILMKKFFIVSVLGTATTFIVAHLACKVPGLRAVLGPTLRSEASLRGTAP